MLVFPTPIVEKLKVIQPQIGLVLQKLGNLEFEYAQAKGKMLSDLDTLSKDQQRLVVSAAESLGIRTDQKVTVNLDTYTFTEVVEPTNKEE